MEAFNFGPTLTPQTLERFLVHCSNNEVSDILLQGGDKIWVQTSWAPAAHDRLPNRHPGAGTHR